MKKEIVISVLIAVLTIAFLDCAIGQKASVRGYINDSETGQPIAYANVLVLGTSLGATSDVQGYYYIFGLPEGINMIEVLCIGYDTLDLSIELKKDESVIKNFILEKVQYDLQEVKIQADRENQRTKVTISEISILPSEIKQTPSIGGIPDIIQHIQTMPGVVSRGDVGGQIYIRGGTPVQTRMLLDEVPVFNPVHSIGLFTVFDNDYIRNVDLFTGGFGAEYGGCISSVVGINTRYGNTNRISGKADLSTFGSRIFLEGPLVKSEDPEKSRVSFILSARNLFINKTKPWFYNYVDHELPFSFFDFYSKLTILTGNNSRINLYGFNFRDNVNYSDPTTKYEWNNSGFGGDIQIMPSRPSMFIKAFFAASFYKMNLDEEGFYPRYSNVNTVTFGFRFKRYLPKQTIKYGLEFMNMKTDYIFYKTGWDDFQQMENSTEASFYFQDDIRLNRFFIEPGIRVQYYATLSQMTFEPRIAAKYAITKKLRIKVAGGLYSQNLISAISDRDIVNFFQGYLSAPVKLVLPEGEDPNEYFLQKSSQLIAGVEMDVTKQLSLNIEAYYKDYPQLINFNKNKILNEYDFPDHPDYMTKDFIVESGYAEGIDVTARYDYPIGSFSVSYSLAVTERTYDDPNLGEVQYYPHYDRRHNLNVTGSLIFGKTDAWDFNIRWNYGSGFPFTPTVGYYEGVVFDENAKINFLTSNGDMKILYGEYNSARLPAYHRLDVSLKRKWQLKENLSFDAVLDIINVYDRENIYYVNRQTNEIVYQLPFLPSFKVGIAF